MSSSASGGPPHLLRARLAEIDAETAVLHARLTVLAAERKSIVQDLRSVIYSGVVSLPPEIIAEIFLQYVTFGEIVSPYPNPHESTPHSYGPLLLSSVCRRWREIALALQPIWSNFVIRTSDDSISSAVSLLERWIPRAGNHPLTVAVLRHDWEMSIFTTLAPAFHHLQSFECFVDCERSFSNDVIRGRVPRLRSLRLSSDVLDEDQVLPEPLTAFSECPLLCEVYLSQFPWLSLVLPWPQITRLTSMSAGECLVIVRQTDALETLIASCYEFDDNWLWDGVPLQLSHLHTFKINRHRESIQLIDRLTLPSLTHIELPLPNQRLDAERLLGLIQRSACVLRSIALSAPHVRLSERCRAGGGFCQSPGYHMEPRRASLLPVRPAQRGLCSRSHLALTESLRISDRGSLPLAR
ncbi:hypothetical protein FB45DRAFT_786366 [Roridomyces roridus]|uniref:F-box domain-containing protein n=1 Tax=Roridomyces roridus TaxID=1738132 RepID=A0AAD7FTV4_9AGAR|nr:hypothetical protein FB45DRAFT_786366 [Roridomyces roridus]